MNSMALLDSNVIAGGIAIGVIVIGHATPSLPTHYSREHIAEIGSTNSDYATYSIATSDPITYSSYFVTGGNTSSSLVTDAVDEQVWKDIETLYGAWSELNGVEALMASFRDRDDDRLKEIYGDEW